jgi:hypothetical protein
MMIVNRKRSKRSSACRLESFCLTGWTRGMTFAKEFPELKQDRDGKRSDDAGDKMGEFIRDVCEIADPLVKPAHSFRFTFSTEASRHNANGEVLISEQIVDQIEGHKPAGKKISRGYVAMPVATLAAAIEKLPNPLH